MIEGRMLVPTDVFTVLCVELAKTSDDLLVAARGVAQKEARGDNLDGTILNSLLAANLHVGAMEEILKAIMEENPAPKPREGSNGNNA